jgi:hypothetical protein
VTSGRRVADSTGDQPDRVSLVVGAVPDRSAAGDLVLPLLEGSPTHGPGGQPVAQPPLAVVPAPWVPAPWVTAKLVPARLGRPWCMGAQVLPTIGSFACAEADFPLVGGRRCCDPFPSALWTPRAHGAGTGRPSGSGIGRASSSASSGSAWRTAVAFHSSSSWARGAKLSNSALTPSVSASSRANSARPSSLR